MNDLSSIAPIHKKSIRRPWLWPVKLIGKFWLSPVQPGLWLINKFYQSILDINNDIPWMVHFTSCVTGNIAIGKGVWISFAVSGGCYIQGGNNIKIGDGTIFGPGVKIISANHNPDNLHLWIPAEQINIGKNCWIGANALILPGVKLGDNVTVGGGAVVTKSFPEGNCIIAGNPAILIKKKLLKE